mmetsp:Transcript_10199/g.30098  ORF Transcript_10199/g.30098 Transcript_10199/m.30098 type:complete len:250 (+) Transcript_10199:1144-1893(+)
MARRPGRAPGQRGGALQRPRAPLRHSHPRGSRHLRGGHPVQRRHHRRRRRAPLGNRAERAPDLGGRRRGPDPRRRRRGAEFRRLRCRAGRRAALGRDDERAQRGGLGGGGGGAADGDGHHLLDGRRDGHGRRLPLRRRGDRGEHVDRGRGGGRQRPHGDALWRHGGQVGHVGGGDGHAHRGGHLGGGRARDRDWRGDACELRRRGRRAHRGGDDDSFLWRDHRRGRDRGRRGQRLLLQRVRAQQLRHRL